MRLIWVPLSSTKNLIYGQRTLIPKVRTSPRLDDKLLARATRTWQGFEQSETKWKKTLVKYTERALDRIPYTEWSLRTIPSINTYSRVVKDSGEYIAPADIKDPSKCAPIPLIFPHNVLTFQQVTSQIRDLSERAIIHHRKMAIRTAIAMPFTLPVAIIPVVPNIPFFYMAFRLYCHWKALQGAKHLKYLVDEKQLVDFKLPAYEKTYQDWDGALSAQQENRIGSIFQQHTLDTELKRAIAQLDRAKVKERQKTQ